MERILILMSGQSYTALDGTVLNALNMARHPERISFGLTLSVFPSEEEETYMTETGSILYRIGDSPWQNGMDFWQGENMVLMAHEQMLFTHGWDSAIIHERKSCGKRAVLTGWLPSDSDCVDAVMPVASDGPDANGDMTFRQGISLHYASRSMRAAFLNPSFCFGPAAFFQQVTITEQPLFLQAFEQRWELYTLRTPLLRMRMPLESWTVHVQNTAAMREFGRHFGLSLNDGSVSSMIRTGLMTADLQVPMRVPWTVRAQEMFRNLDNRRSTIEPLMVTSFLSLPGDTGLDDVRLAAFRRMIQIRHVSLLCYADPANIRKLLLSHPNILEFKRRYGLPTEAVLRGDEACRYVELSHAHILAHSREKFLDHTHYIWTDFDYLHYPVYSGCALDWENICTDRIVMAEVNGEPDLSMVSVPDAKVLPLCREFALLCEDAVRRDGRLPEAVDAWSRIVFLHPDWFSIIPLPNRGQLLSLTMLTRREEWRWSRLFRPERVQE